MCCHQTYHQELSLRGYYQPGQLPTNCPDTLCWQALLNSPPVVRSIIRSCSQSWQRPIPITNQWQFACWIWPSPSPLGQSVRFFSMEVQVPKNSSAAREAVLTRLQEMLQAINESLLTRKQKLLLYSGGVCPRLSWPLSTQEFPTTWMEGQVDSLVTGYLKKWSGQPTQLSSTSPARLVA